jgi:hypothetical protein
MMFDLIDPLATMLLFIAAIFLLMAVAYGRM